MARLSWEDRMTIKRLTGRQCSNRRIARLLGVSEGTVRYHRRRQAAGTADGRSDQQPVAARFHEAIDAHRGEYGVEPICRELPIAPSTYYESKARAAERSGLPARAHRDAQLREHIGRVWEENYRVYGVRKVWRQLQREGIAVARCTVARLMRELGLRGVVRGRRVKTTTPMATLACPADRVNRVFQAPRPDALWLAD